MNIIEQASAYPWINTAVRFRQDTDLGYLAKRIEERVILDIPSGITKEELYQLVVNNLQKYLTETDEGRADLAKIQDYGLRMAQMFAEAFDTLKGRVSDEVSTLSEKILDLAETYTKNRLGFVGTEGILNPTIPSFVSLSIDELPVEEALKGLMTKYEINVDTFNSSTCKYFIDKIPNMNTLNLGETESTLRDAFSTAIESVNEDQKKDCMRIFESLISDNAFKNLRSYLFGHGAYSGKITEQLLLSCLGFCYNYPIFKEAVQKLNVQFSDEAQKQFDTNVSVLDDMHTLCSCFLELGRQKFKEKLVIGHTLLNGEALESFQKSGGTFEDIATHLRLHYNDNEQDVLYHFTDHQAIPLSGISTQEILIAKPENIEKMNKLQNEVKMQMMTVKQSCTREAFSVILKQYLVDLKKSPELLPANEDCDRFLQKAVEQVNHVSSTLHRNNQMNVEDAVYHFYLNTWMKDTLVSTIYYRMGAEVISQLNHTEAANEALLNQIHVSVMSDILTSYLAKVFLRRNN